MLASVRLTSAFSLAVELHGDHIRKGTGVPYLTHLMMVSAMVGEYGGDEDLMIAALLHDALEDRPELISLPEIVHRFGWRVGRVVEGCSDCQSKPKPPWEQRKRAFLDRLRTESADVKLVAAADKLHNANTLLRDAQHMGDDLWRRFNAPKDKQCWYLRSCVVALKDGWWNDILTALDETVTGLETLCSVAN
jgi:(p)ppGpp synthase/HD superfamily hydrolase